MTKFIFKTIYYNSLDLDWKLSLDMMDYVDTGWEIIHVERDMLVFRKAVDPKQYESYRNGVADRLHDFNSRFLD